MLSVKKERILFALLYCFILSLELSLLPEQEVTIKLVYQYLGSALILTLLAFCIRQSIRDRNIYRRIQKLKYSNNLECYVAYVCNCAKAQPKLAWLQNEKFIALAFAGRIAEFENARQILLGGKNKKKINYKLVDGFHQIFMYFKGEATDRNDWVFEETTLLEKTLRLISWSNAAPEASALIPLAQELLDSPFRLYQTVAAIVLSKHSLLSNKLIAAKTYADKAVDFAPSPEVEKFINEYLKHI